MTPLDQALDSAKLSQCKRNAFYALLVESNLLIPTREESEDKRFNPILAEVDGNTYLMVFDSEEKLSSWAQVPIPYTTLPGHTIAEITQGNIHWILNPGTEYTKILTPDEINWLKELIAKFKNAAS